MAFEILNEADSVLYVFAGDNRYPQAEPDKVDFDILAQGVDSEGVVSGCVVTPQGAPDTTVAVAAGVVRIAGTDVAFAGGNVNCGAAAVGFPRFDLIAIDNAGVASAVAGVAAGPPVFPAVPANSVIVAAVWRAANDNTITAADIVDKRCLLLGDALGTTPTLIGIVGGIATPNRSHHTLSSEAGAADDLDGLAVSSIITNGEIVIIRPDAGDAITVKHNALGGADARNILCIGNADIVCDDDHDFVICIYASAIGAGSWMALQGGAGGGLALANKGELHGYAAADAIVAAAGADNQVLQSDAADAEGLTWRATPRLASISDTGGAAPRIKFFAASPHVEIDDDLRVERIGVRTAPNAFYAINIAPTEAAAVAWTGVRINPILTLTADAGVRGVDGFMDARLPAGGTLSQVYGLEFTANMTAQAVVAQGAVLAGVVVASRARAVFGGTLTVDEQFGLRASVDTQVQLGGTVTVTATTAIKVPEPVHFGGATSHQNYKGLHIEDYTTGAAPAPVTNYLMEIGPATPYLRVMGNFTAAGNRTPVYISEGAGPALRQLRTMDPGAGGANFAGGELVCILV